MSAFQAAAAAAAMVALTARMAGREHRLLHIFQIEHYEPARLILWLRRRRELVSVRELLALGALYAAAAADAWAGAGWVAGGLLLASCAIAVAGVRDWRRPAVKPLVLTARAKRLLGVSLAPAAAAAIAALTALPGGLAPLGLSILLGCAWLLLALAAPTLLGAGRALAPYEAAVNRRFVESARERLAQVAPLVVGVTGSYGKTTTKRCLGAVLGAEMQTLITPASFNSLLGVVRSINEGLRPEHEAFVVEMGMYRRGDIAELCELVHPRIGVITAIGPMHLERLGSIEAIAAAKAELMEALPAEGGHLITNADDPRCLEIARRAHVPVTLFGIENPRAQVRASGLRLAGGRTELELALPAERGGESVHRLSAKLLGRHNVSNLLAAAAVGVVLGIEPERIAAALSTVSAPEHRLAPLANPGSGVLVIDDAYNSNPAGAAAALEVLAEHEAARRVLVTPGMVELGDLEEAANRRFGEQAAAVCDLVVLVGGRRTEPIRAGLAGAGLAQERLHTVESLQEASALLARVARAGDVILFENDLPDTYAEDGAGG